jgi:hypothetical protein
MLALMSAPVCRAKARLSSSMHGAKSAAAAIVSVSSADAANGSRASMNKQQRTKRII